ncbi:co-chaperonin GroES (HSP10) [Paraburkholderia youngii]
MTEGNDENSHETNARPMWTDHASRIMKLMPLHDRVVLRRVPQERTTAAGSVIPDTAGEKPDEGKVIAIGPGRRLEDGRLCAPDVNVGDRVLFGPAP